MTTSNPCPLSAVAYTLYTQTKADFYKHDLVNGADIDAVTGNVNLQYASSDYRVGVLDTMTCGLSYGVKLSKHSEFSLLGELMQQTVDNAEVPRTGEDTPDLSAVIFQAGCSFTWWFFLWIFREK